MKNRGLLGLYNLLQLAALPLAGPPLLLYGLLRSKYRHHLFGRLGLGRVAHPAPKERPRIWIHALSVGEINSAVPLMEAVDRRWPQGRLFLSASTAGGLRRLGQVAPEGATLFPAPLDLLPSVLKRAQEIAPHLFILVETDLWPNTVNILKMMGTATILANGAISSRAARRLARFPALARLLFAPFDVIVMQSRQDNDRLAALMGDELFLAPPGNLKYDKFSQLPRVEPTEFGFSGDDGPILVAGSTHPGEELLLLTAFVEIRTVFPTAKLICAPRDTGRGREVEELAAKMGFQPVVRSRSTPGTSVKEILVLDTIGELMKCYGMAHSAFVGGSLVDMGGHDLLEPAAWSIPVLFGPHCESCQEAADQLLELGGGLQVSDGRQLARKWLELLNNPELAQGMGRAARALVESHSGVVERYIELAEGLLHGMG